MSGAAAAVYNTPQYRLKTIKMAAIVRSRITKDHTDRTLLSLIEELKDNRLAIPAHQREYCWKLDKQEKFIESILKGYPIPSILMSATRTDSKRSLEDGRQRITTAMRYRADLFTCCGKKFSELTGREQDRFDDERVVVITFIGATPADRIQIFDWHQNGAPLSTGERYHAHQETSPLLTFVKKMLMTPGEGLHDRAALVWGVRGDTPGQESKDTRRKWLQNAVAMVIGLAFGPAHANKNYDYVVSKGFMTDEFGPLLQSDVKKDIERILDIYESVERVQKMKKKNWHNRQWDLGNFTGYIMYSLSQMMRSGHDYMQTDISAEHRVKFDDGGYSPNSLEGEPEEWDRIKSTWVTYLVKVRREVEAHPRKKLTSILLGATVRDGVVRNEGLHGGVSAARNWRLERWEDGYNRLFNLDAVIDSRSTDGDDDEDEEDSE